MQITHDPVTDRKFFAPLHGLRGIAALFVVVSHFAANNLFLLPIPLLYGQGGVGVKIFFVLSAFLLTTHLCKDLQRSPQRAIPIFQYFIHRVFRIYPLYFFVLIGHVLLNDISITDFFNHLLLLQGWGELWAIPIEFYYYFVIPVVAVLALYLSKGFLYLLFTIAILTTLYIGIVMPEEVFNISRIIFIPKMVPFLLGSLMALLLSKGGYLYKKKRMMRFVPHLSLLGLGISIIFSFIIAKRYLPIPFAPWLFVVTGLSATGLIYSALQPNAISMVLKSRFLVFIGQISFSIYLLHVFALRLVKSFVHLPAPLLAWLLLGFCILAAYISYRLIEQPGIKTGKMIANRLPLLFNLKIASILPQLFWRPRVNHQITTK